MLLVVRGIQSAEVKPEKEKHMTAPTFTMRELLEAGVHFGHHPRRWNPKMEEFIFGVRNGVHIIDLQKTVPMLHAALEAIRETVSKGGRVLFVGTKRQAADKVAEVAASTGQYYVNHRWLGGMLTNWGTVSKSIKRLDHLDELFEKNAGGLTKKERLKLERERSKLELTLGGIRTMAGRPDIVCVIDCDRESLAVTEAKKLGLPVVAIVDTNVSFEGVDYIIPGNDDASRAIELYCRLFGAAVLAGLQAEVKRSGADLGESEEVPAEAMPKKKAEAKKKDVVVEVVSKKKEEAPAAEAKSEAVAEPAAEEAKK